jgi:hypothetical protein
VQWIVVETREDDGKNINIVTRGGAKIGVYASKKDQDQYQWVRKSITTKHKFYVRKKNETFKEARQDILKENIASTSGTNPGDDIPVYDMPLLFYQNNKENPSEELSNLKNVLVSCVKLLNDKTSLQVLQSLLEKFNY